MTGHRLTQLLALSILALPLVGGAREAPAAEVPAGWAEAELAFRNFITPRIEEARKRHNDPEIRAAEYRSARLQKYLPDYRVFVKTGPYDDSSKLFLLQQNGKIRDLGDGHWIGDGQAFRVRPVTEFLKERKLTIKNAEEAVEIAHLTEELRGAPNYVGFLQLNTNGFTVFDQRFISQHYGDKNDWKYTGSKTETGWTVKVEYVGPPAMIQQPPIYDIDVDKVSTFQDLREVARIRLLQQ